MRKLRRGAAVAVSLALLFGAFGALASGLPGSVSDPVITVGWLLEVFTPQMLNEAETRTADALEQRSGGQNAKYEDTRAGLNDMLADKIASQALMDAAAKRAEELTGADGGVVRPEAGQLLTVAPGVCVVLYQGAARVSGGGAADLGGGAELAAGSSLPARRMVAYTGAEGGSFEFTMNSTVQVYGRYRLQSAYAPKYGDLAAALNVMGLMLGDGKGGYMLERFATRIEGLVLMIRMIGDDAEALAYTGGHPLTDVPEWADRYVAYAYGLGWVQGVGGGRFAPDDRIDSNQFMTLLLRSMDYDYGDFAWDKSLEFAERAGILTAGERAMLEKECRRDHLAYISYYSLDGMCGTGVTLREKLMGKGAFTDAQATHARSLVTRVRP
ncbi:MAG: S-layer homology domain-containing protein [Oscillospiraceae bacterium]|nr:S-layer homology domain-containing protein [Oscillospiraceae bacterium]